MAGRHEALLTIGEAAGLLGIGIDGVLAKIRSGELPAKAVGARTMIPGEAVAGKAGPGPGEQTRGGRYLAQVTADLLRALEDAPEFGSCGITVMFRGGKIQRVAVHSETSRIKGE